MYTDRKNEDYIYIKKGDKLIKSPTEVHFPTHESVWDNIRVWYPFQDLNGKYYRTKFKKQKINRRKRTVTVEMELIPEE